MSAGVEDIVGISDAESYGTGSDALYYGGVGSTAENFYLDAVLFVVAVHIGGVETSVFGFGKPIKGQLNFGV